MEDILGKVLGIKGVDAVVLQSALDLALSEPRVVHLIASQAKAQVDRDIHLATSNDALKLGTHSNSVGIGAREGSDEFAQLMLWFHGGGVCDAMRFLVAWEMVRCARFVKSALRCGGRKMGEGLECLLVEKV